LTNSPTGYKLWRSLGTTFFRLRLEWFKEYKKLPSGQLRVFCMLDEEKTSVGECLTAMGAGDELTVTPADTNE